VDIFYAYITATAIEAEGVRVGFGCESPEEFSIKGVCTVAQVASTQPGVYLVVRPKIQVVFAALTLGVFSQREARVQPSTIDALQVHNCRAKDWMRRRGNSFNKIADVPDQQAFRG
jgi:hypothetical protein